MISLNALKELANNKIVDSRVLLKRKRFDSATYLLGYSIEIALKYSICKILDFNIGFPENKTEFERYMKDPIKKKKPELLETINDVRMIKIHDLNKLLFYSGKEFIIKQDFLSEWEKIIPWNPELRYRLNFTNKENTFKLLNATRKVVSEILN